MTPADVQNCLSQLAAQIGRVVFASEEHTRLAFVALLGRGHLLLEGVPGTGKTLFAQTFARCVGMEMRRLQCTPDLMPGDVIGANIFDFNTQSFHLKHGPVFTEFLLADEINRTPPKTQSSLLEAMQERAVTVDGATHPLSSRFTVVATQNPVEHEGTYPLPEAQLDRFLFRLSVDYPPEAQELAIVMHHSGSASMPDLQTLGVEPVLTPQHVDALQMVPQTVRLEQDVAQYAVSLARATRDHSSLDVGLSPRATTMLAAASRAAAACEGRDYVVPDDIKRLFVPAARHRVLLGTTAEMEGLTPDAILEEIVASVAAPR